MNGTEFCRAYVVQLRTEHQRIREIVGQIEHDLSSGSKRKVPSYDVSTLTQELIALRNELARHFMEEEEGGCLEEAVGRCPKVGRAADVIECEHPVLLAELDDIIEQLASKYSSAASVRPAFEKFAQRLDRHDKAEARLLATAFGITQE